MRKLNKLHAFNPFIKSILLLTMFMITVKGLFAQTQSIILGRATDTSITASIMFDQTVNLYVQYGTQSGLYSDSTGTVVDSANVPYMAELSNLTADTKYFYRVMYQTSGGGVFSATPEYTFHTQRAPGSTFTFEVEADEHLYDYGNPHLYSVTMQNQAKDKPDFMFTLGDIFGDDHYAFTITSHQVDSLRKAYRSRLAPLCNSVPFNICLGNHDGEKQYYLDTMPPNNLAVWSTLWRKYYYANPEPNGFFTGNSDAEMFGMNKPDDYYAYTWGDALFVVLDAYRFDCFNPDSLQVKSNGWNWTLGLTQYTWLKNTLQSSTAKYKFVFVHHPLGEERGGIIPAQTFEWGGYAKNGQYQFDTYRPGWGKPIQQLFVDYGVNILFQGHDHLFAREVLDSVIYQEVPMAADSTYEKGILANGAAYTADTLNGSGYIRVTVSPSCVKVDYVESYLPKDTMGLNKNGQVAFSYTIGTCDTSTTTGLNNLKDNPLLNVYPNPANDKVTVQFSDNVQNFTIRVTNEVGQIVLQSHSNIIDVKNLSDGIYLLRMEAENYNSFKKIVIAH
jgi:Secretion system C-terminal sorting domain/Calcineurin-like phosphoesterase